MVKVQFREVHPMTCGMKLFRMIQKEFQSTTDLNNSFS